MDKIELLKKQVAEAKAAKEAQAKEKEELETLLKEGRELGIDVSAFEEDLKKLASVDKKGTEEKESDNGKKDSNASLTQEDLDKFQASLTASIAEAMTAATKSAEDDKTQKIDTIYG